MVLKHTPLGEINLPFVASNAIIPRCRRNRRYHTASALREIPLSARDDTGVLSQARPMMAAGVRRGGAKSAKIEIFYFSLILSALHTIISHYLSLSLTPFRPCSTFAMSLDDKRVSAALAEHES